MTNETSDQSFEEDVINAKTPVLVDFWAEWCGPCRQLAPVLDELAKEMEGKMKIFKMNIDDHTEVPQKIGVRGIPTLVIYKDGKLIATKVGALPKSALYEWVNSFVS